MSEGVKLILTEIRSLKAAVEARLDAVDRKFGQLERAPHPTGGAGSAL